MSSENVLARIDRCLEEGAEDFIVKPVKLSDVKRLKDCMFGDDRVGKEDRRINKRKSPESSDLSPSPSHPSVTSSSSSSPSLSPRLSMELSTLPCSPPQSSSPPPPPPPCPPKSLDSPTSRLKMTKL